MNSDKIYFEWNQPARRQYYPTRAKPPTGLIAVHTGENLPDSEGADTGAEALASFITGRTDQAGSYHLLSDSDSRIQLARFEWTAFGARGYNSHVIHLGISGMHNKWRDDSIPYDFFAKTIMLAAHNAVQAARWLKAEHGIEVPAIRLTKAEADEGRPGFIDHSRLDPSRRRDPGDEFPWDLFLEQFARAKNTGITIMSAQPARKPDSKVLVFQKLYNDHGDGGQLIEDGILGPKTRAAASDHVESSFKVINAAFAMLTAPTWNMEG